MTETESTSPAVYDYDDFFALSIKFDGACSQHTIAWNQSFLRVLSSHTIHLLEADNHRAFSREELMWKIAGIFPGRQLARLDYVANLGAFRPVFASPEEDQHSEETRSRL
jgi:hypothetical protein